jgi:hypothetical protein
MTSTALGRSVMITGAIVPDHDTSADVTSPSLLVAVQ